MGTRFVSRAIQKSGAFKRNPQGRAVSEGLLSIADKSGDKQISLEKQEIALLEQNLALRAEQEEITRKSNVTSYKMDKELHMQNFELNQKREASSSEDYRNLPRTYQDEWKAYDERHITDLGDEKSKQEAIEGGRVPFMQGVGRINRASLDGENKALVSEYTETVKGALRGTDINSFVDRIGSLNSWADQWEEIHGLKPEFTEGVINTEVRRYADNIFYDPTRVAEAGALLSNGEALKEQGFYTQAELVSRTKTVKDFAHINVETAQAQAQAVVAPHTAIMADMVLGGASRGDLDNYMKTSGENPFVLQLMGESADKLLDETDVSEVDKVAIADTKLREEAYETRFSALSKRLTAIGKSGAEKLNPTERATAYKKLMKDFVALQSTKDTEAGSVSDPFAKLQSLSDAELSAGILTQMATLTKRPDVQPNGWAPGHPDRLSDDLEPKRVLPKMTKGVNFLLNSGANSEYGSFSIQEKSALANEIVDLSFEYLQGRDPKDYDVERTPTDAINQARAIHDQAVLNLFGEEALKEIKGFNRNTDVDPIGRSSASSVSTEEVAGLIKTFNDLGEDPNKILSQMIATGTPPEEAKQTFKDATLMFEVDTDNANPKPVPEIRMTITDEEGNIKPQEQTQFQTLIVGEEGFRANVYIDTEGNETVGHGHKLTASEKKKFKKGDTVPQPQIDKWFKEDMARAEKGAKGVVESMDTLPKEVQEVITSMVFQMGKSGVLEFKEMRKHLNKRPFTSLDAKKASLEMLDSDWAKQTPERAQRHAKIVSESVK